MGKQGVFYMEDYKHLQQFESVETMNEHIKAIKERFEDELNRSSIAVLDYIAQHACSVIGVAYVRAATIAAGVQKSLRTVVYATKLLSDLEIITKQEVMRKKQGGNGANVYVINSKLLTDLRTELRTDEEPFEPTAPTDEQPENAGGNSFKNSFKSSLESLNKKSVKAAPVKWQPVLFSNIPELIKKSLALLDDNALSNAIWKKVIQAYVQSDLYNALGNVHLQTAIQDNEAFYAQLKEKIHNVVYAQEHGSVHTDVLGYVYGTCRAFFNDEATTIIENNAPEIDYEESVRKLYDMLPIDRVSAPVYRPFERATTNDLNELGIF